MILHNINKNESIREGFFILDFDKMIDRVNSFAGAENVTFGMQDRELLYNCLSGKTSFEDMIDQMIEMNRIV